MQSSETCGAVIAREQGGTPSFEPGTLREHDELRRGQLLAQRGDHGRVARHAADQQHAPQFALPFLQQRDHFVRHAVMQRVQDVLGQWPRCG